MNHISDVRVLLALLEGARRVAERLPLHRQHYLFVEKRILQRLVSLGYRRENEISVGGNTVWDF